MEYHTKIDKLDLEVLRDAFNRVNEVWSGNRELDCRVCYALGMNWIDENKLDKGVTSWRHHIERSGYTAAWVSDHVISYDEIPRVTTDISAAYRMIYEILPQHDDIRLARDPSGVGAALGNWYLSHPDGPTIMEYANVGHADEALALLTALLKIVININTNESETDTQFKERTKRAAEA